MLIHELFNKDTDIVPLEASLIVLDIKSDMCITNNVNYTNHTKHISRGVYFVRNGEKIKIHEVEWCEGGLQLAYIATNNVG